LAKIPPLSLNQAEIEAAITNYVTQKIQVSEDQEIKVELQATRGVNGYMDLHRFCSGQVLMLSGPLFEGHG
jgi:hypothetical protein